MKEKTKDVESKVVKEELMEVGTPMIVNTGIWKHRLLVGTPVTGLMRVEWVQSRYNQVIPTNWSLVETLEYMSSSMPLRFQVSDAENLIVKSAIERDVEWLWFIEQDNILPSGAFIQMNQYMRDKKVPIISGVYFTKSVPPEPLVYRGYGNSFFQDWKFGDKVWCDGIPFGCTLIHMSILREMWNESPEYSINGRVTRRVFEEPAKLTYKPELQSYIAETGTSDLAWCKRVIEGKYFEKAGWGNFIKKHPQYPFLVDTNMFLYHCDDNGRMFPLKMPERFIPSKKYKPRNIL